MVSYNNLGIVYKKQGSYRKAIEFHKKALKIQIATLGENHSDVAASYNNLGTVYYHQSNYKKAIEFYNKSLKIDLTISGESDLAVAKVYSNLGIVYYSQGYDKKAIEFHEKALKIILNLGENHPNLATSYNNLGIVYNHQNNYKKAMLFCKKTLRIILLTYGKNHPDVINAYINMGTIYQKQNSYDKAMKFYRKSLRIALFIFGEKHPDVAMSCISIGDIYDRRNKHEKAIRFYRKALNALNFTHTNELHQVNSLSHLVDLFQGMGKVYYNQYSIIRNPVYLTKSKYCLQQAMAVNNFHSKSIGLNPKNQLAKDAFDVNELSIATNQLLHKETDSIHYLHEAFTFSENTKAYQLLENMQESEALSFSGIPDSLLEQEYDFREQITFHEKQRQKKFEEGFSTTDNIVLAISSKLFDTRQDYDTLKAVFEKQYPEYYRLKYDFSTVALKEVQQNLIDSTQTLLEYFVGDSSIYIYVINKDDFYFHEIKKDFPLEDWVKTFHKANTATNYATMTKEYAQSAHQLYEKLVAPVAKHLKEKIIIVPDGILGYLPFEALLVKPVKNIALWKDHHYWLKDKHISYCYSATLLKEMKDKKLRKETTKNILAFAPFSDGETTLLASTRSYPDSIDQATLKPLPFSRKEVEDIQKIAGGDAYHNKDATKEQLTQSASDYSVIHLATHGKADDKNGDYCHLAFAQQKDNTKNELLYVRDLYNLELNAEMVVLSACETGIGELQKGEGLISLARGFTYAGTKSIVTSLWSVNDASTKDIMVGFYKHLKNGMTKDAALRQAKLDYIEGLDKMNRTKAHPFFWSAFIGIGDMQRIEF